MLYDNIINETRRKCLFYRVCNSKNGREKMRRKLFELGGIAYLWQVPIASPHQIPIKSLRHNPDFQDPDREAY